MAALRICWREASERTYEDAVVQPVHHVPHVLKVLCGARRDHLDDLEQAEHDCESERQPAIKGSRGDEVGPNDTRLARRSEGKGSGRVIRCQEARSLGSWGWRPVGCAKLIT